MNTIDLKKFLSSKGLEDDNIDNLISKISGPDLVNMINLINDNKSNDKVYNMLAKYGILLDESVEVLDEDDLLFRKKEDLYSEYKKFKNKNGINDMNDDKKTDFDDIEDLDINEELNIDDINETTSLSETSILGLTPMNAIFRMKELAGIHTDTIPEVEVEDIVPEKIVDNTVEDVIDIRSDSKKVIDENLKIILDCVGDIKLSEHKDVIEKIESLLNKIKNIN